MSEHLMALLSRVAIYDAEYSERLSNHRPMALIALNRLGADDVAPESFFNTYANDPPFAALGPNRPRHLFPIYPEWLHDIVDRWREYPRPSCAGSTFKSWESTFEITSLSAPSRREIHDLRVPTCYQGPGPSSKFPMLS